MRRSMPEVKPNQTKQAKASVRQDEGSFEIVHYSPLTADPWFNQAENQCFCKGAHTQY